MGDGGDYIHNKKDKARKKFDLISPQKIGNQIRVCGQKKDQGKM